MPTRTYQETVTRTRDECDFCGKEAGSNGTHRCVICERFACVNCGVSDHYKYMLGMYGGRAWLCNECNKIGEPFKNAIRMAKEGIKESRKLWNKRGKENAKK